LRVGTGSAAVGAASAVAAGSDAAPAACHAIIERQGNYTHTGRWDPNTVFVEAPSGILNVYLWSRAGVT
jgi:hypothetical protein